MGGRDVALLRSSTAKRNAEEGQEAVSVVDNSSHPGNASALLSFGCRLQRAVN